MVNKKNAKSILLKEMNSILPKQWMEQFEVALSILKHSEFSSMKQAENFLEASLAHVLDKKVSEFKHLSAKCESKGERNGVFYLTVTVYFKFKDEKKGFWKLSKSLHAKKRKNSSSYD